MPIVRKAAGILDCQRTARQGHKALARVVVGGMITSRLAIMFLLPVLASYWLPEKERNGDERAASESA